MPDWRIGYDLPAGKDKFCDTTCLGPQGPAWSEISKYLRCTDTAYSGKTVAAGPPDHCRTEQVGRHQAVYVRVQIPSNFDGKRPLWAEWRRETDLDFARRKHTYPQRDTLP